MERMIPKIPARREIEAVTPPRQRQHRTLGQPQEFEHFWQLVLYIVGMGIRGLPSMIRSVLIPLGIVTVLNILIESYPTYMLVGPVRPIGFLLIFITASYNSAVPRAIYWIILLTLGKKIFYSVRQSGLSATLSRYKSLGTTFGALPRALGQDFGKVLMIGAGIGLIFANYLTRNNRLDKVSVLFVMVIAILDTITRHEQSLVYTGIRLMHKDASAAFHKERVLSGERIESLLLGVISGLMLNLIFGVLKLSYGGYILGLLTLCIGYLMIHVIRK